MSIILVALSNTALCLLEYTINGSIMIIREMIVYACCTHQVKLRVCHLKMQPCRWMVMRLLKQAVAFSEDAWPWMFYTKGLWVAPALSLSLSFSRSLSLLLSPLLRHSLALQPITYYLVSLPPSLLSALSACCFLCVYVLLASAHRGPEWSQ